MSRSTVFSRRGGSLFAIVILLGVAPLAHWLDTPMPAVDGAGRVSDGDSFHLGADRIRLLGLDAPELAQDCIGADGAPWPCGAQARDRMAALLAAGPLECYPRGRDRYDRVLARCTVNQTDIGAAMVSDGMAVSTGDYWREEAAARSARRGIWSGAFETPADWREDHARSSGFFGWLGL